MGKKKDHCCNPFSKQRHSTKPATNTITPDLQYKSQDVAGLCLTEGQKVCVSCWREINAAVCASQPPTQVVQPPPLARNVLDIILPPPSNLDVQGVVPVGAPVVQQEFPQVAEEASERVDIPEPLPQPNVLDIIAPVQPIASVPLLRASEKEPVQGTSRSQLLSPHFHIADSPFPWNAPQARKVPKITSTITCPPPDYLEDIDEDDSSVTPTTSSAPTEYRVEDVNVSLETLGETPLKRYHVATRGAMAKKFSKAKEALLKKFELATKTKVPLSPQKSCSWCNKLKNVLPTRFGELTTRREKYLNLTCVPPSMPVADVIQNFRCSSYEARQASKLKTQFGPFYAPPPKDTGRPIDRGVQNLVVGFYLDDANSRVVPESRRTVLVSRESGEKERVAKRWILMKLEELYREFCNMHPVVKIGVTKFSLLRPRQCVWPGIRGHHTTCVCVIHENFKILCDVIEFSEGTKAFLDKYLCEPSTTECFLGYCAECPKSMQLHDYIREKTDEDVMYHIWESTDRADLKEIKESQVDFIQRFDTTVPKIAFHHYVNNKQTTFLKELHTKIEKEESITCQVDFGMNYSFVNHRDIQSAHFSPRQCTVHPFCVHYFDKTLMKMVYKSYTVISDDLIHNSTAFYVFLKKVMPLIQRDFPAAKHIYFISDGSAAQYKNYKNIANLVKFMEDFGLTAEWHNTATAHGKSQCDGISAVVKRETRLYSLKPGNVLRHAHEMAEFCQWKWRDSATMETVYVSNEDVRAMVQPLERRYSEASRICGIQRCHAFKPKSTTQVEVRVFSSSQNSETFALFQEAQVIPAAPSHGSYVAVEVNNKFQVGVVDGCDMDNQSVEINFMKRSGSRNSFSWPNVPKVDKVELHHVLGTVEPPSATSASGRLYKLDAADFDRLTALLAARLDK